MTGKSLCLMTVVVPQPKEVRLRCLGHFVGSRQHLSAVFRVPHRGSVNPSPLGDGEVGRI